MVNYVCAFSQSESEKYFEWIINIIIMLESFLRFSFVQILLHLFTSDWGPGIKKLFLLVNFASAISGGRARHALRNTASFPNYPICFTTKVYAKNQNILFWTYQEPYFKGAVLQHSSSFCFILSITRPQWLWNLKSAKKLHVNDKIRDPR